MSPPIRSWTALSVLVFVGNAAVRPAMAGAATDDEPTVTPAGSAPATAPAPAPAAPAPYPAPPYPGYPPPGYPPPGYPPPGYPPPGFAAYPGYPAPQLTKVHRPRRGLVVGGVITFGVTWGVASTISLFLADGSCSSSSCRSTKDYLWIPIAGPTIVAARDNEGGDGILYLWSAAQAAGIIMFVIGLAGHDVMEYRYARRGPTLQLAPMFARDTGGMALTARW